jgi:hypothetical protein
MGLSETILAAMIGAIATVSTALFQLFNSLRQRNKDDTRTRKGSTMRSVLAVLALMIASAAGGFLYSEFLKQRSGEDMRAMRQELKDLTALIAQGKSQARETAVAASTVAQEPQAITPVAMDGVAASVESVAYVPACRSTSAAPCGEGEAQRIALCGTIPSYARVERIDLFAQPDAVQQGWDQHRATLEQDIGGARFTGKSFEYAQGGDQKAVCSNFMHWSSDHPHIARILIAYGFGAAPAADGSVAPEAEAPAQTPAVIAADSAPAMTQAASFPTPVRTQ